MTSRDPRKDDADIDDRLVQLLWALDEELIAKSQLRSSRQKGTNGASDTLHTADAPTLDLDPETADKLDSDRAAIELLAWAGPTLARVRAECASAAANGGLAGPTRDAALPDRLGRFEIVRELGRGGLGIVLLARDPVLGRAVALKIPRPEALFTSDLRARFEREAQAAARLTHPNLVPVYEVGEVGSICYIASAYCAGPNLGEWQRAQTAPIQPRTAATFVAQLADAIDYAHGEGVLHRDLKPSNVLLVSRDATNGPSQSAAGRQDAQAQLTPKITDFGLARIEELAGQETRTGLVIGTPAYMSPEQAEGRRADIGPAADVYGLGAILYELLTGQAPFRGQSDADTLRRVVADEPRSPRRMVQELSRDLEAICLKCLEKSPARRYATAGELAADLRRFLAGEPTLARPIGALGRLLRWSRREPVGAALVAVILASVAALVALSIVYIGRLQDARDTAEMERVRAETVAAENARNTYGLQMRRGFELQSAGDIAGAQKVLDAFAAGTPYAQLRGFDWYYLKRLLHAERLTLTGHRGHVNDVLFSPNGRLLLSGGDDGTIRGWDPASGQELSCHQAHPSCVNTIALSPDGRFVASGSCDRTIRVWEASTWKLLTSLEGHPDRVEFVAFSPADSNRLASCGNDPVLRIWDVAGEGVSRSLDTGRGSLLGLAWMADGKTVLAVGGNAAQKDGIHGRHLPILAWDTESDATVDRLTAADFAYAANAIALGRDDATIGLGGNERSYVQYLRRGEPKTKPVPLDGHVSGIQAVALSHDDKLLASGGFDSTIRIWDTTRGLCERVLSGHSDRIAALVFAPREALLASASFDGTIKLWGPLETAHPVRRTIAAKFRDNFGMDFNNEIAMSADCRFLALRVSPERVVVIDLDDGNRQIAAINVPPTTRVGISFPASGGRNVVNIVQEQGRLLRWNFRENRPENGSFDAPSDVPVVDGVQDKPHYLVLSPDGKYMFDIEVPRIRVIATGSGEMLREFPHGPRLWSGSCCFSPDGNTVGVNVEGQSHLCDLTTGTWRDSPEASCVNNGATRIGTGHAFSMSILDPASPQEALTLHHAAPVLRSAFSRDGRSLATWIDSREVCLWDVATGERVAQWSGPPGQVCILCFSADGRKLCAVTIDPHEPDETGAREDDVYAVVWRGDEGE